MLARRLLAYEVGAKESPEAFAAAGERAYLQLRARLLVLLGSSGFDALWARAVYMAQREFRPRDGPAAAAPTDTYGLHAAVRGQDSTTVQQTLVATFASFIALLFTFIGEELGVRFICQIWPDLLPDATESGAEESTS
jgi:hypothetical protein